MTRASPGWICPCIGSFVTLSLIIMNPSEVSGSSRYALTSIQSPSSVSEYLHFEYCDITFKALFLVMPPPTHLSLILPEPTAKVGSLTSSSTGMEKVVMLK